MASGYTSFTESTDIKGTKWNLGNGWKAGTNSLNSILGEYKPWETYNSINSWGVFGGATPWKNQTVANNGFELFTRINPANLNAESIQTRIKDDFNFSQNNTNKMMTATSGLVTGIISWPFYAVHLACVAALSGDRKSGLIVGGISFIGAIACSLAYPFRKVYRNLLDLQKEVENQPGLPLSLWDEDIAYARRADYIG